MAKYRVKQGCQNAVICTVGPEYRNADGRFELDKCTQRDLKYLYDVVKCPYVEVSDEQKSEKAEL